MHRSIRRGRRAARFSAQHGVATLVVVMVLFFIVSLVAAYTSRNLIFEQRTSANQYRSTQAFEAADAGIEWALSLLNGGRIGADCRPSNNANDNTFRDRYLSDAAIGPGADQTAVNADGSINIRTRITVPGAPLMPACVFNAAANSWSCDCPTDADPALPTVADGPPKPMFRIRFEYLRDAAGAIIRPDIVRIVSAGCTRPDPLCLLANPLAPAGDALAVVSALTTIKSGLTTPPAAPLTARGSIVASTLQIINTDPASNGLTVNAGQPIDVGGSLLRSLPGTPGAVSVAADDPTLQALVADNRYSAATDPLHLFPTMMSHLFGMKPDMYQQQPAALEVPCPGVSGCGAADISVLAAANPGRMLWLNGNFTLDGNVGTADRPVLLIVNGNSTLTSGALSGVIYGRTAAGDWDIGAGTATVRGALIAENGFIGNAGTQTIEYDAAVLNTVRTRIGSFVRVPGGWKDF